MKLFRCTLAIFMGVMVFFSSASSTLAKGVDPAIKDRIAKNLTAVNSQFKIASIAESELKGFYKVQLANGPKIYVSGEGTYFFRGTMYKMDGNQLVDITEKDAAADRVAMVGDLIPKEMIVFSPQAPVKTKAHINVFTDVDCFYCQKLHREVPELNARGIEVRYSAFPRAGVGSPSYNKIVSAWCAGDPQDALTKLKNREEIPAKTCENPVEKQYQLGKNMGVTGTPAIVLDDGTMIPGYRPAADLAKMLGI